MRRRCVLVLFIVMGLTSFHSTVATPSAVQIWNEANAGWVSFSFHVEEGDALVRITMRATGGAAASLLIFDDHPLAMMSVTYASETDGRTQVRPWGERDSFAYESPLRPGGQTLATGRYGLGPGDYRALAWVAGSIDQWWVEVEGPGVAIHQIQHGEKAFFADASQLSSGLRIEGQAVGHGVAVVDGTMTFEVEDQLFGAFEPGSKDFVWRHELLTPNGVQDCFCVFQSQVPGVGPPGMYELRVAGAVPYTAGLSRMTVATWADAQLVPMPS